MTLLKIITIIIITTTVIITIIIIMMMIISTTIFQNITDKLEKITYFVFTIFFLFLLPKVLHAAQKCKRIWKIYKRSYVNINKHMFKLQTITEKILKRTYFLFAILGVFLLLKVLHATRECKRMWKNYKRSYVNINKHSNMK